MPFHDERAGDKAGNDVVRVARADIDAGERQDNGGDPAHGAEATVYQAQSHRNRAGHARVVGREIDAGAAVDQQEHVRDARGVCCDVAG